jgi:hypothetical protein
MTTTPHKHIVPPTKPITPIDAPVDHPKTAPAAAAPKVATRQDLQDALQALVDANCASYGDALANARNVLGLPLS